MLARTKKLALAAQTLARRCLLPAAATSACQTSIRFAFCQARWNRSDFNSKLQKQISELEGGIQSSDPENQAYFKKHSWNIRFIPDKTLFQFSKTDGEHEVKVLTYVKQNSPNSESTSQPFADRKVQWLNYSQTNVYIKKTGSDKWLAAQVAVFDGSVELLALSFTNEQPSFNWSKSTYPGPELSTLPEEVTNGISMLFKQFGVTPEILTNMAIHSSIKVDELDVAWLKELKEVCA